jgi:tRNA(Ile)-lysidine synthase
LLSVGRADIESYCYENGLEFVTDQTNNETVYTRNKIRHNVIPLIEKELNPSFCDTVTNNVRVIAADVDFIENCADEKYSALVSDNKVLAKELSALPQALSLRIIRRMIADNISMSDISSDIIFSVLELAENNRTGARCNISGDLYARIEYGYLVIEHEKAECEDFCYKLKMGEEIYIPQTGYTIRIEKADRQLNDGAVYFTLPDNECEIILRNRRRGDRFVPSGMNGTKSVKDFMINEKIPQPMRSRVGIVTFNQEIGWIVGYRRDNRFKFRGNGIKIWISY